MYANDPCNTNDFTDGKDAALLIFNIQVQIHRTKLSQKFDTITWNQNLFDLINTIL